MALGYFVHVKYWSSALNAILRMKRHKSDSAAMCTFYLPDLREDRGLTDQEEQVS